MNKLKRRSMLIAVVAIIFVFMTQPTVAYYTTIGTATNVVTSGGIELTIHEHTADGSKFPEQGVYIIPGDIVSKVVTIENTCGHPFYLRAKLIDGVNSAELSSEECFDININTAKWELREDGWLYYKDILQPGATSEPVFTEVEIVGAAVNNKYIGKTLTLTVSAQAVQSENNPADFPWEADGWPVQQGGNT